MGAKYDLLKIATIAGTLFSVYNAFTESLMLEDLLLVILLAAMFVAVANDVSKTKSKLAEEQNQVETQKDLANAQQDIANAQKDLAKAVEETIKKELAAD